MILEYHKIDYPETPGRGLPRTPARLETLYTKTTG